jgi:hypothetical protein
MSHPPHIWNKFVPHSLIERLHTFTPLPPLHVRKPNPVTVTLLRTLQKDTFLLPAPPYPDNASVFLRPKSAAKAAFIADLRGVNKLTPLPLPHFALPSMSDIGHVLLTSSPLWGTTIDLTNFFWSLLLPAHAWGAFRTHSLCWNSLPFGWNLSPVLAQHSLAEFIFSALQYQNCLPLLTASVHIFHYYDDILVLCDSAPTCAWVTGLLTEHLRSLSLIISPKSCLVPQQDVLWLGKHIRLVDQCISNTDAVLLRLLALTVLLPLVPIHAKVASRICGFFLWAHRPHLGATLFLRSLYITQWQNNCLRRPPPGMCRALGDLFALSLRPWNPPAAPSTPWNEYVLCCDAAAVDGAYQIGIFGPTVGCRILRAPPEIQTQQAAELYAIDATTRLAARLGMNQLTLVGDNLGAIYLTLSLRPPLSSLPLCRTLRRLYNRLLWSKLTLHLIWVPSALQPADPPSRACPMAPTIYNVATQSQERWLLLLQHLDAAWFIGTTQLT